MAEADQNTEEGLVPLSEADQSKTNSVVYWQDQGSKRIKLMFDPWSSREKAYTIHTHAFTSWAENIHMNYLGGALLRPATFRWQNQVVYIIGRGVSLGAAREFLEKGRKNPAIFLNHAFFDIPTKPFDFCFIADPRVVIEEEKLGQAAQLSLITFPGIPQHFITRIPWQDAYGFTFWARAPLNDWMRRLYPYFPQLDDTQGVCCPAIHLAAVNGAKAVVLIGCDHTLPAGDLEYLAANGEPVKTVETYAVNAMATSKISQLCNHHVGMRIINTSRVGLAGVNLFADPDKTEAELFKWFEFKNLDEVYKEFEEE